MQMDTPDSRRVTKDYKTDLFHIHVQVMLQGMAQVMVKLIAQMLVAVLAWSRHGLRNTYTDLRMMTMHCIQTQTLLNPLTHSCTGFQLMLAYTSLYA